MIRLSAVIITYNEEKNIARCLDSLVKVADEIIVVDSFSTDATASICKQYELVRFIEHKFDGHIQQKNWALRQASSDYILSLDADECLDEDLIHAILEKKSHWNAPAFQINRLTNYCGKWVKHSGWHPDWNTRLFDRRSGKWTGVNPHDRFEVTGNQMALKIKKGLLLHYSYYHQSQHIVQLDQFTTIKAQQLFAKDVPARVWKFTIYPIFKFFRHYVLKLGFLDGLTGFIIAKHSAYYAFVTYSKLWYLHHRRKIEG